MPGEKTEKATPKKRQEQRKEGNIVLSQDIVGAGVLLAIFGLLKATGGQFSYYITNGMKLFFGNIDQPITGVEEMKQKFLIVLMLSAQVLIPLFLANIAVSVVATMTQSKLFFKPSMAKFKFGKLNPLKGIKGLFSLKAGIDIVKSIVKICIIGYLMFDEIKKNIPTLLTIYNASVGTSVSWTAQFILDVCFKACAAFVVIGVADYFFQWWDYERRIRMSKEDIKEEYKQMEGNPTTKGRIKKEQFRMARMRQIQAVPSADVVIRNPTHYAIALKYDRDKARAPIVVAKGQNNVALKIVEVAMASNVHIIENRPLAQALFKTVEVGDEIPEEFYKAVAEVLAYIYRLKRAGRS